MTDPKTEYDLPLVMAYFKTHKKWPKENQIKAKAEAILSKHSIQQQILWFNEHPPLTGEGCLLHVVALSHTSPEKAKKLAKDYWHVKDFSPKDREDFLKKTRKILSEDDHMIRINRLFFQNRYQDITYLLPLIKQTKNRRIIQLRLLVAKNQVMSTQRPLAHLDDGMRYQWARFCRINGKDEEAYQWMTQRIKDNPTYACQWWQERNIMARRFMEYAYEHPRKREVYLKKALDVITHNGLSCGEKYADACFLSGFLEYQMKHPGSAFKIFTALYEKVKSPMSKSRLAYWAALSAMKAKNGQDKAWFEKAAQYTMTFYGQVACLRLKKNIALTPGLSSSSSKAAPPGSPFQGNDNVLPNVLTLFDKTTPRGVIQDFCFAAIEACKNLSEAKTVCAYVQKHFPPDIFIKTCKTAGFKFGINPMGHKDMPTLKLPKDVGCTPLEWATVHAIIYRESQFSLCEKSLPGALGLMQLMPKTAYATAKKLKISVKNEWDIMNQEKNIRMGSNNFKHVLDMRKGSYILALCDYNTAMTNVNIWLGQIGDPRCKNIDVIEWIESIPFFETRAYVIRVLENVVNYLLINGHQDKAKMLFKRERIIREDN